MQSLTNKLLAFGLQTWWTKKKIRNELTLTSAARFSYFRREKN